MDITHIRFFLKLFFPSFRVQEVLFGVRWMLPFSSWRWLFHSVPSERRTCFCQNACQCTVGLCLCLQFLVSRIDLRVKSRNAKGLRCRRNKTLNLISNAEKHHVWQSKLSFLSSTANRRQPIHLLCNIDSRLARTFGCFRHPCEAHVHSPNL